MSNPSAADFFSPAITTAELVALVNSEPPVAQQTRRRLPTSTEQRQGQGQRMSAAAEAAFQRMASAYSEAAIARLSNYAAEAATATRAMSDDKKDTTVQDTTQVTTNHQASGAEDDGAELTLEMVGKNTST